MRFGPVRRARPETPQAHASWEACSASGYDGAAANARKGSSMTTVRVERFSDSPLVESVTEIHYDEPTREWSTPDGRWELVVLRSRGKTIVLQTGLISRPVLLENAAGDSLLAISFKPGVFAPCAPGATMLDRALVRPLVTARSFAIDGEALEIPTFESADQLVQRLATKG